MFPASAFACLLGLTFAWAAGSKLLRWRDWRAALEGYGLSAPLQRASAPAVPLVEAAVVALVFAGATRSGAALSLFLLASFSAATLRAHALRGARLPCGCFGKVKERDYRVLLIRNAFLAASAAIVILQGRDVDPIPSLPEGGGWVPAALTFLGVGALTWLLVTALGTMRRGQA